MEHMRCSKSLPNITIWKAFAELRNKKLIILSRTLFQNNFEELRTIMRLLLQANDEVMDFLNPLTLDNMTYRRVDEIRKKLNHFVHIHNGDILVKSLKGLRESVMIPNPIPSQKRILPVMEKHKGNNLDSEYKISLTSVHPSLIAGMEKLPKEVTSVVKRAFVGKAAKRSI
jgi:DNA repair and recombination RAD54-like protein